MESEDIIIHIDWNGPHSLEAVARFNGPSDWGIYQIYGGHPVYGRGVLLYIGKTESDDAGFAGRVPNSAGRCLPNRDGDIEVHLGRLIGVATPNNETWERQIGLAERLLIYAHMPAYNRKLELNPSDKDLFRVHVLNWRHHRDLLPEVSGARWTDCFEHIPYGSYFSTEHFTKPLSSE